MNRLARTALVVGSLVVFAVWSSRKLAHIPQPERFVARQAR